MIDARDFSRVLRSGLGGAEHSPIAAASVIDDLVRERDTLRLRVEQLERLVLTEGARAPLVNAYACGFRACQDEMCKLIPPGSAAEDQVRSLRPDPAKAFTAANEERLENP